MRDEERPPSPPGGRSVESSRIRVRPLALRPAGLHDSLMLQARVLRNHARILAAAQDAAAEHGWSGMTLASVGKAAGLTPRPVRDRYPNKALLGAATWAEVAGPALLAALSDALSAAGLLDEPSQEGAFVDSMNALARPKTGLRAAAELLVVSAFEVDMRAAVEVSLGATLREWLDPDKAGGPARAARRGYLLALSLGLICVARRPGRRRSTSRMNGDACSMPCAPTASRFPCQTFAGLPTWRSSSSTRAIRQLTTCSVPRSITLGCTASRVRSSPRSQSRQGSPRARST